MKPDPSGPGPASRSHHPRPRRLFVFESGWRVGIKIGSEREFCGVMAPGQDFYHRFHDGEIFLQNGDQRICLACADRRGLLADRPKSLREPRIDLDFEADDTDSGFDLATRDDPEPS